MRHIILVQMVCVGCRDYHPRHISWVISVHRSQGGHVANFNHRLANLHSRSGSAGGSVPLPPNPWIVTGSVLEMIVFEVARDNEVTGEIIPSHSP